MKKPHAPAIFIRWNDTTDEGEWADYNGPVDATVESICWLIEENEKGLVISSHHCRDKESAEWGHIWHIPHGAIVTWYELDIGKRPW